MPFSWYSQLRALPPLAALSCTGPATAWRLSSNRAFDTAAAGSSLHGSSDAAAAFELGFGAADGFDDDGAFDGSSPEEQAVNAAKATKTTARVRISGTLARTA